MSRLLTLLFAGLWLVSCNDFNKGKQGTLLAKVGNSELTLEEARAEIPDLSQFADSADAYRQYRDKWIEEQLILQEAQRLKIENSKLILERLDKAREQVIINSFSEIVLNRRNSDIDVSTEEAQLYYQEHKNKFLLNERHVKFRHMVAKSFADAEQARNDLMAGATWADVAEKYSLYPDLLLADSERFVSENNALSEYRILNRYLHIIGVTEISPIEKIGNQFHFVQLMEEKAPGEPPELTWLIPQIQNWLTIEKRRRAFNSYLKNLYLAGQANDEIVIYDNLPKPTLPVVTDTLNSN